ncbi:MAG: nucleotide exchange factor GrpE [Minisyncoccia bacterium]
MAITFGKSSPDSANAAEFRDEPEDVEFEADPKTSFGSSDDDALNAASSKAAKLREELSACKKEKQEYMDGWQRAKADYVNALKRFGDESKVSEFRGKVKAVETLLPAFDALERAKEHGEIPEGFQAIAKQLESAFASLGLEEVGVVGEPFNPALHEAFGQDATNDATKDDTITAILEKGWKIGEDIIRAAKVRVAHFASEK